MLRAVPRSLPPLSARGAEVLRLIGEQRVPVFLTVHANGRRRYGYWQAVTSASRPGSCQVALPTDECEALHEAGRITLGEPVIDPAKTTYPVRAATAPARTAGRSAQALPRHVLTA